MELLKLADDGRLKREIVIHTYIYHREREREGEMLDESQEDTQLRPSSVVSAR